MPRKDVERRREYDRQRRERIRDEALFCPECEARRSTPETLRVHRWLAHDVRTAPPKDVP
jgi:hypothetical protein